MGKRLGGRSLRLERHPEEVYVYRHASMAEAVERYRTGEGIYREATKRRRIEHPPDRSGMMVNGDEAELAQLMELADRLIDAALVIDPRLVKRAGWVRAEDGVDACPALIASGDDRPCFDRRRLRLADQATTEPVRVVISTDSKEIHPANAAAFIAATKLAQQFRPLEVWWQGAWLREPGRPYEGNGHVLLTPLVQGDMDFRRVQFVLADPYRDNVSYRIMFGYAWPKSIGWGAGVGERSYLEETFDFIRETGMRATPEQVAEYAARWAGLEPAWMQTVGNYEARQHWSAPEPAREWKPDLKAQREAEKRWRERQKEIERERVRQAREREQGV